MRGREGWRKKEREREGSKAREGRGEQVIPEKKEGRCEGGQARMPISLKKRK